METGVFGASSPTRQSGCAGKHGAAGCVWRTTVMRRGHGEGDRVALRAKIFGVHKKLRAAHSVRKPKLGNIALRRRADDAGLQTPETMVGARDAILRLRQVVFGQPALTS